MEDITNEKLYSSICGRFDILEQLMKMILINDILDEKQKEQIESGMDEAVESIMLELGISDFQFVSLCKRHLLILYLEEKITLNRIRGIKKEVGDRFSEIEPVFCFPKINAKRRKIFEKEKISYGTEGKELYIL